jgi:hypothetical protein
MESTACRGESLLSKEAFTKDDSKGKEPKTFCFFTLREKEREKSAGFLVQYGG